MLETTTMSRRLSLSLLPDELIYEILLKLPVKSLLRFRCVCKLWKTIISIPQFVKGHLHTSKSDTVMTRHQRLAAFINDGQNEIVTCSVQSLFENRSTPAEVITFRMERKCNIIGSCNGLLCLHDGDGCFRLWNPTTRLESKRSPPAVDCLTWNNTHLGFGYDQVNDKYKVLLGVYSLRVTKIHTFGTNYWTTIQNFPCTPTQQLGKFVSGTLNWFARKNWRNIILSFDLEKETYGDVPLPPAQDSDYQSHYALDVLSDCLCVCFCSDYTHWVVWLMKKYGLHESWSRLMVIPNEKLITSRHLSFHPLCILENGIVLGKCMDFLLVMYNQNNGTSCYAGILERFDHHIQIYCESLVSP